MKKRCKTCKHWNQTTFNNYKDAVNDGKCKELPIELEISIKAGWSGGYVEFIETQSNFGCTLYEKK